jgi:predicted DNA-binding transcriptional regulator AlpA
MQFNKLPDAPFIRMSELASYSKRGHHGVLPVSAATVWSWVRNGKFPAPVKISTKITAWRTEDVRKYLADLGV